MDGSVVVENDSGAPLRLTDPHGCKPDFTVVLGNDEIPATAAFTPGCNLQPLVIAVGESRFPFTIAAVTPACVAAEQVNASLSPCARSRRIGPLPTGDYRAIFIDNGSRLPPPSPVPVQVTSA